jgi:hypothetical protein
MVDNFDLIRAWMLDKQLDWKDGDCYYVQLLRRQSDDPMTNGVPDPNYHGNMHSRSIKDYFIPSIEYFDRKRDEIKKLCDTFNVRAYIRLNKRNYQQMAFNTAKHIMEQACSGQTFNSPFTMIASAAGTANAAGKDKTWICDLDEEYVPYTKNIKDMICSCEPHASNVKWFILVPLNKIHEDALEYYQNREFFTVPTKHGIHIVCKPFNTADFKQKWDVFVKEKQITAPLPQHTVSNMENGHLNYRVHFSLTDMYLKHINEFSQVCQRTCSESVIITTVDKNKTIVHVCDTKYLPQIKQDWNDYCLTHGIYMKCFDIHKDNPTGLYFP